jgi:sporulation protein YlmC with PRC-barrel domain
MQRRRLTFVESTEGHHIEQGDETMRSLMLAGTAAIVVISSAVYAQTTNNSNQPGSNSIRSNLTQMLQKSGYTDIKMAPTSYVVHAKDNDGNPVVMSISPDAFTEVTSITNGTTTGNAARNDNAGANTFVNVPEGDDLSSKVVGLDIYNNDNKDIGTIKDVAMNPDGRVAAYIVSVGGFLGMGEHYVAVNPSAVKVTYGDSDKKWHASMNANADQLKNAPEFKYTGKWSGSRT